MSTYSYKLYKNQETLKIKNYTYTQLSRMTTYQLREVCIKEKLAKNRLGKLDREELIHLIMTFRGVPENRLITTLEDKGIERLEALFKKAKKKIIYDENIKAPSKISLYEKVGVSLHDNYKILTNQILKEGNVLLVDDEGHIATVFNLISKGEYYYLVKEKQVPVAEQTRGNHFLLYFNKRDSDILYDVYYNQYDFIPSEMEYIQMPILEFKIQPVSMSNEVLLIDFGTCNTTLGIYDEIKGVEPVKFLDATRQEVQITPLIPSVIGVKSINEDQIEYVFGYEAMALAQSNYIKNGIHLFYDIKRWVSDYERMERITSEEGQYTWVKRKELLKAYFNYIIDEANTYFKTQFKEVKFLTPVRQKKKFDTLFKELFTDYTVTTALDEGLAVLFNTLSEVIEKEKYRPSQIYKALIMDCGGGTTDLTACEFKIENKRIAYHIKMHTSYENGDINFGGNNLTYRLMQFIKLNLLKEMDKELSLYKLFKGETIDYDLLEKFYKEAEEVLPTSFKAYENASVEEYFKVKQNFYYLFSVAEKVKQSFFDNSPLYEITLGLEEKEEEDPRKGHIVLDKWKLSVKKEGKMQRILNLPEVKIYHHEVNALLRGDIYRLVQRLLEPFYESGELMSYQIIKLTGQSCKVPLFREALKEFIPGRYLSYNKKEKEESELKMSCLYGALKYYRNINLGYLELERDYIGSAFPYELSSYTHQNEEKILIHGLQKNERTDYISRFKDGMTLKLYLKDMSGKLLREYEYVYRLEEFKMTTYYQIEEQYQDKIIQSETDNIENEEIKFFVWVDEINWGFYLLPILRQEEQLYSGKLAFFDFENDTWEENFFDGNK